MRTHAATIAALASIAAFTIAAVPARAEAGAAALPETNVQVPVSKVSGSVIDDGDAQFRQLFADWRKVENNAPDRLQPLAVSVPSRMPVHGATLTSPFGYRNHPILGGRRRHEGVDLAAPTGTPIYATADGVVERAQVVSGYGNFIEIEHGGNLETRFGHLSRLAVSAGDHVNKGDLIGYVGSTGRSTGPHLHYEVRVDGQPVDPMPYMSESPTQMRIAMLEQPGGAQDAD